MRNGLIAAWKTKKDIKKGEQIFSNYGYDYPSKYDWYNKEYEAYYNLDASKVKKRKGQVTDRATPSYEDQV